MTGATFDTYFTAEERENFRNAFDAFDEDRDEFITVESLEKVIRAVGFNPMPEEVEDMIEDVRAPTLNFDSFMYILYRHAREADPETELVNAFRVFDKEGSGRLKLDLVRDILKNIKRPFSDQQISELFSQAEVGGDDCVNYVDFVKVMLDF